MLPEQVPDYLRANPKMAPVIEAAVKVEEAHAGEPAYLGWTWDEVRAYPATLMKLVVDGVIRVNFKSQRQTRYLMVARAAAKHALGGHRSG
ncbi:MAG: hypothetical protein ACYDHB_09395 [Candidatus Dormibacteria bacterium]